MGLLPCATGSRASANLINQISVMLAVQSRLKKYSATRLKQISNTSAPSCPARGALAIVTDVGTGCDGRGRAADERH